MIQNRDGSFSEMMTVNDGFAKFFDSFENGDPVRSFHVGTFSELEKIKEEANFQTQLNDLKTEVEELKPVKSKMILIPTDAQIKRYCRRFK